MLGVFFVLPIGGMLQLGFWPDGSFDPGGVVEVFGRERVHRVLAFTAFSAIAGTLVTLVLGVPTAYVLCRLRIPGRRVLQAGLLVPFVLPTVVVGIAFRQLLAEGGPLGFLELSAKLGYLFYDLDITANIDDPTDPDFDSSDSGEDLFYGVGVGVTLFERLHAKLEYEKIDLENVEDANAFWLTGQWRF